MQIHVLKSKIHRATVTGASLNYEGSLTIDLNLMEKVGFLPYERVLCSNMANGNRFETYLIAGERGSGDIVLNGVELGCRSAGEHLLVRRQGQNYRGHQRLHPRFPAPGRARHQQAEDDQAERHDEAAGAIRAAEEHEA